MATEVIEKLTATLRRLNPAKVRVWCGEESRDVAVPTRRRKWTQVIEAIESQAWTRCELLDKAGAALGYVDSGEEGPTSAPAATGSTMDAGLAAAHAHAERVVALVLRGQEQALRFRDAEHTALLKAMENVVRVQTEAMQTMQGINSAQIDAASEVARLQAEAEASGGSLDIGGLLKALPHLAPLLGMFRPAPPIVGKVVG